MRPAVPAAAQPRLWASAPRVLKELCFLDFFSTSTGMEYLEGQRFADTLEWYYMQMCRGTVTHLGVASPSANLTF